MRFCWLARENALERRHNSIGIVACFVAEPHDVLGMQAGKRVADGVRVGILGPSARF
jgi:hypothetical protein